MIATPFLSRLCPMNLEGAPSSFCEGGLFRWNGADSLLFAFGYKQPVIPSEARYGFPSHVICAMNLSSSSTYHQSRFAGAHK